MFPSRWISFNLRLVANTLNLSLFNLIPGMVSTVNHPISTYAGIIFDKCGLIDFKYVMAN